MESFKKDKLLQELASISVMLDAEIEKYKIQQSNFCPITDLVNIKRNIESMIYNLKKDSLPNKRERSFGLWRLIVDTWPREIKLGEKIIKAELEYDNF